MITSGLLLVIIYFIQKYIVTWITYYNNTDICFDNSIWRWTYDYKVIGYRDVSDLDDKPFVGKRRNRNRTVSFMCCNFFLGFMVLMSFTSSLFIFILQ